MKALCPISSVGVTDFLRVQNSLLNNKSSSVVFVVNMAAFLEANKI